MHVPNAIEPLEDARCIAAIRCSRSETIRIAEERDRCPRWCRWKQWVSLEQPCRLSTKHDCFNGLSFCVVNPNYLNSIHRRQSHCHGRQDLVRVFLRLKDGRINSHLLRRRLRRIKK